MMVVSPLRVLSVEDNAADARLLLHEIQLAGFLPDLRRVETEEEFRAHLDPLPDIVLCDYGLPQFDALQALAILREHDPDVPFVIISGSIGEETAVHAIKQGAADYLMKDRLGRLEVVIRRALDQRQARQAERAARDLLARDALLLSNVRDAVIVTDLNGIVTFWNEGATRLLGWTAEEMVGRPYIQRYPETMRHLAAEGLALRAQGGEWNAEFEDWRKDGSRIWVHRRVTAIVDSLGRPTGILGISYDISERKRIEETERQNQRLLQTTLDALPPHMAVLDNQGNILMVNKAWRDFYEQNGGTSATCGVGANYFQVYDNGIRDDEGLARTAIQGIRDVLAGCAAEFVREYPCDSPTEPAWYVMRVTPIQTEGQQRVLVAHENITERKNAEIEREAAREDLRRAMGQANCLLWQATVSEIVAPYIPWVYFDPDRKTILDWDLQFINHAEDQIPSWLPLERELDQPAAAALSYSRLPEDDYAAAITAGEALLTGKPRYTQTFRNRMTDGSLRYLFEDVRIIGELPSEISPVDGKPLRRWRLVGVLTDVTERKLAEKALRASEERFRTTLDNLMEGCQIISPEWRYLYVNATAELHGHKPLSELLGRTMMEAYPGVENSPLFATLRRCMEQRTHEQVENEFFYEDGTSAWFQLVIQPVAEGIFVLSEDITERKRAEHALLQAHEELEARVYQRTEDLIKATQEAESARLDAESANRAKSEFLSRMSHELRTPLNAILGFGQILERQNLTPLQRESVEYILSGGRHLLNLINEVLDITRVEAGRVELAIEPIPLADMVAQSWDMVRTLAVDRDIQFTETVSANPDIFVLADSKRFKQVFINLLSNAIKYNYIGGSIAVSCYEQPDDRVRIAVHDTGPGIAPEELPRLFTAFERLGAANSEVEGTGLGLVLSQALVTAMGGILGVDSVVGQGSTFFVEFPQARPPLGIPVVSETPMVDVEETVGETKRHTILCIEDKLSNLHLLEAILENRPGIELLSARQGQDGLRLAREKDPDLILLDLNLPDMTGQDVLAQLRQSGLTRDIPVVVISADATEKQIHRLLYAGAQAYLTKPLDVAQFLHTVDTVIQGKEAGKMPTVLPRR